MTRAILTCSPHFTELALNEVRRCHPEITVHPLFTPGFCFLEVPYSFDKLTAPWRHQLPIYLHHLFPVHATIPLENMDHLKEAIQRLAPPEAVIQVRSTQEEELPCSITDIRQFLNRSPNRGSPMTPIGRVVSVLITHEQGSLQAYLGISWATQNLSPWAGGQIPITEPVSNRAGYKLLEALTVFGVRLRSGDLALDLGASPGAWTTLLRQRGLRVTAVAPTPLYPWLMFDAGVTYHSLLAQDYLQRCDTTFDLIVNDMKLDAQDSAHLMVEYAVHLRREGIAIMTLKLRGRNQQRVMDHTFRLLRKVYKIIRVRQLVSNQQEVTLFLRRRS